MRTPHVDHCVRQGQRFTRNHMLGGEELTSIVGTHINRDDLMSGMFYRGLGRSVISTQQDLRAVMHVPTDLALSRTLPNIAIDS